MRQREGAGETSRKSRRRRRQVRGRLTAPAKLMSDEALGKESDLAAASKTMVPPKHIRAFTGQRGSDPTHEEAVALQ